MLNNPTALLQIVANIADKADIAPFPRILNLIIILYLIT